MYVQSARVTVQKKSRVIIQLKEVVRKSSHHPCNSAVLVVIIVMIVQCSVHNTIQYNTCALVRGSWTDCGLLPKDHS